MFATVPVYTIPEYTGFNISCGTIPFIVSPDFTVTAVDVGSVLSICITRASTSSITFPELSSQEPVVTSTVCVHVPSFEITALYSVSLIFVNDVIVPLFTMMSDCVNVPFFTSLLNVNVYVISLAFVGLASSASIVQLNAVSSIVTPVAIVASEFAFPSLAVLPALSFTFPAGTTKDRAPLPIIPFNFKVYVYVPFEFLTYVNSLMSPSFVNDISSPATNTLMSSAVNASAELSVFIPASSSYTFNGIVSVVVGLAFVALAFPFLDITGAVLSILADAVVLM